MNYRKKLCAAVTAAAVTIAALSGCNNAPASKVSEEARQLADTIFPGDRSSFTAWKDIDPDTVIAYVDSDQYGDYFNIKFGDLYGEYMYYLVLYGITDDMSDAYRSTCESYRDNIVTYLTFEKMYLYTANTVYGINETTLTEEQQNEIIQSADLVKSDWAASFYDTVSAHLGENATNDEIDRLCGEVLDAILEKCGLTDDIFTIWERNKYIEELVITEIVKNATADEAAVRQTYDDFVAEAVDMAENDPAGYEAFQAYSMVYIPGGTRTCEQIFLPFADDGSDRENVIQTANDIRDRITAGEDFTALQQEYGSEEGRYFVLRNSPSFDEAYITALYQMQAQGDVSEPVVCADGVYILKYDGTAEVSDSDRDEIMENIRSYELEQAQTSAQNAAYNEWTEKFNYVIDYDLLKIDKSNDTGYGTGLYEAAVG